MEPLEVRRIRAMAEVERAKIHLEMCNRIDAYYKGSAGGAPPAAHKTAPAAADDTAVAKRPKNRCAMTGCKRAVLPACKHRCCGPCCYAAHIDKCPEVPLNRRGATMPPKRTIALKKPAGKRPVVGDKTVPRSSTGGKDIGSVRAWYGANRIETPWRSSAGTSEDEEEQEDDEESESEEESQ